MSKDITKQPVEKATTEKPPETVAANSPKLVAWGPLVAILFTVVIYFLAQIAGAIILNAYAGARHWGPKRTTNWLDDSAAAQFAYAVIASGTSIGLLLLFLRRRKTSLRVLGFHRGPKLSDLGYVVAGFIVYFLSLDILTNVIQNFYHNFNVNQQQAIGFQSTGGHQLLFALFSLVILPPLVEETLFRGFLYSGLRRAMPVLWAALLTSALFAVPHLFENANGGLLWIAGLDTFVLSLTLVYVREKTHNLWACIGLHMLKNFLAFLTLFVFRVS